MRKFSIVILGLLGINSSFAQSITGNKPEQFMLSLGAGYSNLTASETLGYGLQQTSEIPELSGTLEYFILSNYALGVNAAYQSLGEKGYYSNNIGSITPYTENISRFNIAVRSTIYFTKASLLDFYGGLQIGYEYWYYNYSLPNPYQYNSGYNNNTTPTNSPTLQAFIGGRAHISQDFSTYVEVGTGVPYWAELGFSLSIGGNPVSKVAVNNGGIGDYGTPPPAPVNH
jgi:hypothetical protein